MSSHSGVRLKASGGGGAGSVRRVALGLALGPAVALGFARFAYALLLPAMREELRWSYAFAGAMNTANAAGYLAGSLAAAFLIRRLGSGPTFSGSLLVTALSLLATGLTRDDTWLLLLRTVSGAAGAVVFVAGATRSTRLAASVAGRTSGFVFTSFYAGAGAGIAVSGALVPALGAAGAPWEWGWIALGLVSLAAFVPAHRASRRAPEDPAPDGARGRASRAAMAPALAAYFLFGVGYIAYMTYSAAFLLDRGLSAGEVAGFWVVLGLAAVASPAAWSGPIARWRGGAALAALLLALAAGVALPLLVPGRGAALLSAVLFGGSFLTTAAAMSALVRRLLPPHHWAPGIAAFTVVFAVGQTLGPWAAGAIADGPGGLEAGLGLSAATLLAGALVALAQPSPGPRTAPP